MMKLYISFLATLMILICSCKQQPDFDAVKIGEHSWMIKNLDVITFKNGDTIPESKTKEEWVAYGTARKAAWCYYNNDIREGAQMGKLYNWYAVNDPRGLAPLGWHVPSDNEWDILADFLGGTDNAGDKMKITNEWEGYEEEDDDGKPTGEFRSDAATNESGFSAYPSGVNTYRGLCATGNFRGCWWSTTKDNDDFPIYRLIYATFSDLDRQSSTDCRGASIRCLKD